MGNSYKNVSLPSIDITVTKSITIFYNLLDTYVLNYTEDNTIKSLVDCIQLCSDTSFNVIEHIFVTPSYEFIDDNVFSLHLSNIESSADSAKPFGELEIQYILVKILRVWRFHKKNIIF